MASRPINLSHPGYPSNMDGVAETTIDSEIEDEVDQLDSDSEGEENGNNVFIKKAGLAGSDRIPGHSLLPALRLENIIQADGVTGNLALSKEGLFILSIATEEFIKRMACAGQLKASSERRTYIDYSDMAAATQQYQEFMFLGDTIPTPLSLSEALWMREAKEKELFDDDPAMSVSAAQRPSVSISSLAPRTKAKSRNTTANGQDRRNGSTATSKRERKLESGEQYSYGDESPLHTDIDMDGDGHRVDNDDEPISGVTSNRREVIPNGRLPIPVSTTRPSALTNGHSSTTSRSSTMTPALPREEPIETPPHHQLHQARASVMASQEEPWPGQYTGPASGFLQGPGGPFGHVAQNPGRTIYSHHRTD